MYNILNDIFSHCVSVIVSKNEKRRKYEIHNNHHHQHELVDRSAVKSAFILRSKT